MNEQTLACVRDLRVGEYCLISHQVCRREPDDAAGPQLSILMDGENGPNFFPVKFPLGIFQTKVEIQPADGATEPRTVKFHRHAMRRS